MKKAIFAIIGLFTVVIIALAIFPSIRDEIHWRWVSREGANTIRSYKSYLLAHPRGKFVREAESRISTLLTNDIPFDLAAKTGTQEAFEQFLKEYPGHQKVPHAQRSLQKVAGRAIVDLKYPDIVESDGSSSDPKWSFMIHFRERNGVSARINCTSLRGPGWYHPSPPEGNIRLSANGKGSYSSWVRGKSLRGDSVSVSFSIVDANGYSSSATANFTLK